MRDVGPAVLQLVGLVLLVAWGAATWGLSGALFVAAMVFLFLGFAAAQVEAPMPPAKEVDELWTF